jgi:tetratricopeptide (TPR) repeat protein
LFLKKGLSPFFRRAAMVVGLTMGWAAPTIAAASNPDYESCQQASDLDIVIASCTRAIDDLSEAAVTRSSIFLRRGNAYVEKSRLDAAIADFSEAISLDTKNSFAYGARAVAYWRRGDRQRAAYDYRMADALNHKGMIERRAASAELKEIDALAYEGGGRQPQEPTPGPADACAPASVHWTSTESLGTLAAYKDHLARFPNCAFATLATARIAKLETHAAKPEASKPAKICANGNPPGRGGRCSHKAARTEPARKVASHPKRSRPASSAGAAAPADCGLPLNCALSIIQH